MACGQFPADPMGYWQAWQWVDGVVCFYGDNMGVAAFMLIFFGATFVGLYQASGSLMLPLVVLIALAPMVMFLLPAVGIQFVMVVMVLGMGVGGFWLWMRLG